MVNRLFPFILREKESKEFWSKDLKSFLLTQKINSISRIDFYEIMASYLGDIVDVIRETYAHPYEDVNNDKSKELLNKIKKC